MRCQKAFTIIEIIVVLVIIGILAAVAVPNYFNSIQQAAAKNAKNNLISIYNAQKAYYLNKGSYCLDTSAAQASCTAVSSHCANSLAAINCNLSLNITDTNFTAYACSTDASGFTCKATSASDANLSVTLKNNPIVLPGASNCTTGTSAGCNPSCSSDVTIYCPN